MAGRPRKPTKVLELSGAFDKNPKRKKDRVNEPQSIGPLGDPPAYFDFEQIDAWHEIINRSIPGLFGPADYFYVEMCADYLARYRAGTITIQERIHFSKLLGQLGFSPTERSKIQMPEKPKESKWSRHGK